MTGFRVKLIQESNLTFKPYKTKYGEPIYVVSNSDSGETLGLLVGGFWNNNEKEWIIDKNCHISRYASEETKEHIRLKYDFIESWELNPHLCKSTIFEISDKTGTYNIGLKS